MYQAVLYLLVIALVEVAAAQLMIGSRLVSTG